MAYTQGSLARRVMGVGVQVEKADRAVKSSNDVVYVEHLDSGDLKGWYVELTDGSTWRVPAKVDFDEAALYADLKRR